MGSLAAYYGNDKDGQGVDEPCRTVTTKERFGLVESTGVIPAMTDEQIFGAHRVATFLREHGVVFEGEFATVEGYVIVDLGMRMLIPRELFRAQGFPDEYVIDRAWVIDPATGSLTEIALTKEQQIRMCGNSVCPPVMTALIAANVPELSAWSAKERRITAKGATVAKVKDSIGKGLILS
jgi:DNA (cytosine-5)-methyltransferase 1